MLSNMYFNCWNSPSNRRPECDTERDLRSRIAYTKIVTSSVMVYVPQSIELCKRATGQRVLSNPPGTRISCVGPYFQSIDSEHLEVPCSLIYSPTRSDC